MSAPETYDVILTNFTWVFETNISTSSFMNITTTSITPPVFNDVSMMKTLVYGTMFVVSLIGNVATVLQMHRLRKRKSTINTLIVNLATADLFVTFFCMAGEGIWQCTVQWVAGNVMCKIVKYMQTFGFYLSTYITVVISLDRCCVILDPMSRHKAPQRIKYMIIISWILSAFFSIPQVSSMSCNSCLQTSLFPRALIKNDCQPVAATGRTNCTKSDGKSCFSDK